MLNEKKVVKLPPAEIVSLNIGGSKVFVKTYLSAEEQDTLTAIYMSALTGENGSIAFAERSLMISVIETCTDIELVKEEEGTIVPLVTVDEIFANYSFWIKIKLAIKNYEYFREILDATVEAYRESIRLSVSLGVRVENIIERLEGFVEKISSGEGLSPESISQTRELLTEINQSEILQESIKAFKNTPSSPRKTTKRTAKKAKIK